MRSQKLLKSLGLSAWLVFAFLLVPAYFIIPYYRYADFQLGTFDFGILLENTQKLSHSFVHFLYSRGLMNWADKENYLSLFFMPLNFLPHSLALHVLLHSFMVYVPGWILFFFCQDRRLKYWLPLFYWLSPGIFWLNQDLIHVEGLAPFFILLGFAFWKREKGKLFLVCWGLALLCKEDVAVSLGIASGVLYLLEKKDKKLLFFSGICAVVFVLNRFLILPIMRDQTCLALGATVPKLSGFFNHSAPWFNRLAESFWIRDFWLQKMTDPKNGLYAAQVLWPLVLACLFVSQPRWIALLLLPAVGVMINILGGSYLIELHFHYDHTTTSLLMIALFLVWNQLKKPNLVLGLWVFVFMIQLGMLHQEIAKYVWQSTVHPDRLSLKENPSTQWAMSVGKKLPSGTVISADYTSLVYLLQPHLKVMMFENPFRSTYFGFYGVCTELHPKLLPEVVILREPYSNEQLIPASYLKSHFQVAQGHSFDVWFEPSKRSQLLPIFESIR